MLPGRKEFMAKRTRKDVFRTNSVKEDTYPHFRHYKKSGHPALILSEEDDQYNFRRVTSSEKSGHHKNEKIEPNPDKRRSTPMYIVKQRQKDKKKFFSKWKYSWKYPSKK